MNAFEKTLKDIVPVCAVCLISLITYLLLPFSLAAPIIGISLGVFLMVGIVLITDTKCTIKEKLIIPTVCFGCAYTFIVVLFVSFWLLFAQTAIFFVYMLVCIFLVLLAYNANVFDKMKRYLDNIDE